MAPLSSLCYLRESMVQYGKSLGTGGQWMCCFMNKNTAAAAYKKWASSAFPDDMLFCETDRTGKILFGFESLCRVLPCL